MNENVEKVYKGLERGILYQLNAKGELVPVASILKEIGLEEKDTQKKERKINDKDIFPKGIIHSGEEPHIYPHT